MGNAFDGIEALDRPVALSTLDANAATQQEEESQQDDDSAQHPGTKLGQRPVTETTPIFAIRLDHQPRIGVRSGDLADFSMPNGSPNFGIAVIAQGAARDIALDWGLPA